MKRRNPIAKAVTRIRPEVKPPKKGRGSRVRRTILHWGYMMSDARPKPLANMQPEEEITIRIRNQGAEGLSFHMNGKELSILEVAMVAGLLTEYVRSV